MFEINGTMLFPYEPYEQNMFDLFRFYYYLLHCDDAGLCSASSDVVK